MKHTTFTAAEATAIIIAAQKDARERNKITQQETPVVKPQGFLKRLLSTLF